MRWARTGHGEGADIVGQDVIAAFGQGAGLGGAEQGERAARGDGQADARVIASPVYEPQDVFGDGAVYAHLAHLLLKVQNVRAGDDWDQAVKRVMLVLAVQNLQSRCGRSG